MVFEVLIKIQKDLETEKLIEYHWWLEVREMMICSGEGL